MTAETHKRVSVIIPTHNRCAMLTACLDSIRKSTVPPSEIIVIDNASTDGTAEALAGQADVTVITNTTNVFATVARNQGAAKATGDYLLLIDDDNEIAPGMIQELVTLCDSDPAIAMVGPKMFYAGTRTLIFAGASIHPVTSRTVYRGAGEEDTGQYDEVTDTEHVPNVMMIRRNTFKPAGGFDEAYRMTYSEADLPMRLKRAGHRVVYCPKAVTQHKTPAPSDGAAAASSFTTPMRAYYLARNRVVYMRRFSSVAQFLCFFLVYFPLYTLYYTFDGIRQRNWKSVQMHLVGSFHGWLHALTGRIPEHYPLPPLNPATACGRDSSRCSE